ncbi:MAG: CAP domain-containing protein [Acidimicrobiia bacterium]
MRAIWNRRVKTLVGGLAVAALVSACGPKAAQGPAPCAAPSAPANPTASAVYNLANSDRAANGLPALAWNRQLTCLASEWSAVMGASGYLRHRDLNVTIRSAGYASYRTLGENILRGASSMTGAQMEAAWMASAPHRANILSSSFTSIGFGFAMGSDGRVYATQNFGG